MKTLFFRCKVCGNVIVKVIDSGAIPSCCNEQMESLNPNLIEKGQEKHVPVVTKVDECTIKVEVGSVAHPMAPEHHISFIYVETENGGIIAHLKDKPEATFCICNDKPVAVYEYCNLHGLWKVEL
jgi:superoxide reductase